jgi:hypothetical protein
MRNQIIIPPKNGWEASTYYVVEVAMRVNNPIFKEIFYSGFLSSGKPNGYNKILGINKEISEVKYLKVIRKINSEIENQHKMVKDAAAEYLLVQNY